MSALASKPKALPYLLQHNPSRFVLFPLKHYDLYAMYKKQLASFWFVDSLDLTDDKAHWEGLSDDERYYLTHILAFFAASDGVVMENIVSTFQRLVQVPEARQFYAVQGANEAVHSEAYSLLIDTYISNAADKAGAFNAVETMPTVAAKAQWALKWIAPSDYAEDSAKTNAVRGIAFVETLVAFAAVEGISFSGSFCSVFWLRKRGLMPGLAQATNYIFRDEGLHRDFACLLYTQHVETEYKLSHARVHEIVEGAVELERQFVADAIPCALIGMNTPRMIQYIEFVADCLLHALGVPHLYNAINPFPWMESISLQSKSNFFERRVTEYQVASPVGFTADGRMGVSYGDRNKFDLEADF